MGGVRPSPPDRAGRLVEFVDVVKRLLNGDTVTFQGRYLHLVNARLDELPVGSDRITMVVGGGHPEVLRVAAQQARVVALSGLARTLPDGHRHEVRWSAESLQAQLQLVSAAAVDRPDSPPEIEALVQVVTITDDRESAIEKLGERVSRASQQDLEATPFVLIGTPEEMAAQLVRQAEMLGITRYVVREPAMDSIERVLPLLEIAQATP